MVLKIRRRQHWEARKEDRLVASVEWHLSQGLAFWRIGDVRQILNLGLVQFHQFLIQCLAQRLFLSWRYETYPLIVLHVGCQTLLTEIFYHNNWHKNFYPTHHNWPTATVLLASFAIYTIRLPKVNFIVSDQSTSVVAKCCWPSFVAQCFFADKIVEFFIVPVNFVRSVYFGNGDSFFFIERPIDPFISYTTPIAHKGNFRWIPNWCRRIQDLNNFIFIGSLEKRFYFEAQN